MSALSLFSHDNKIERVSHVEVDAHVTAACAAFDYEFTGESRVHLWSRPNIPEDFGIGLIVGPSGSGKSTLLVSFGEPATLSWDSRKAIVSHFATPDDAIARLSAVGLNTIPSWVRPFHVLSNGEQFRATLARTIADGSVCDEFTSVVDRDVAKAVAVSVHRFIAQRGFRRVVFATCHYDIIPWLKPDWIFDTASGQLSDGRAVQRDAIVVDIYPSSTSAWPLFAPHHYLTSAINNGARCFVGVYNDRIVGFSSSLAYPNVYLKKAWREHRTVVLPDFQGMGIGPRLSDAIAAIHVGEGKRYYSRTSHPRLAAYRDRSPRWRKTSKHGKVLEVREKHTKWQVDDRRIAWSHEYIGGTHCE